LDAGEKAFLIEGNSNSNTSENIETNENFRNFFSSWKTLSKLKSLRLKVIELWGCNRDIFCNGILRNLKSLESLEIENSIESRGPLDRRLPTNEVFHLKGIIEALAGAKNSLRKFILISSKIKVSGLPEDIPLRLQDFGINGCIILEDDLKILQRLVNDDPSFRFSIGTVIVEKAEKADLLLKEIGWSLLKKT